MYLIFFFFFNFFSRDKNKKDFSSREIQPFIVVRSKSMFTQNSHNGLDAWHGIRFIRFSCRFESYNNTHESTVVAVFDKRWRLELGILCLAINVNQICVFSV